MTRWLPAQYAAQQAKRQRWDLDAKPKEKPKDNGHRTDGWPVFEAMLKTAGLPLPVYEFRFDERHRWRWDMAWPRLHASNGRMLKVAVEVNGGAWSGGRHVRGEGYLNDLEKLNAGQIQGWIVLQYPPERLANAIDDLKALLNAQ